MKNQILAGLSILLIISLIVFAVVNIYNIIYDKITDKTGMYVVMVYDYGNTIKGFVDDYKSEGKMCIITIGDTKFKIKKDNCFFFPKYYKDLAKYVIEG